MSREPAGIIPRYVAAHGRSGLGKSGSLRAPGAMGKNVGARAIPMVQCFQCVSLSKFMVSSSCGKMVAAFTTTVVNATQSSEQKEGQTGRGLTGPLLFRKPSGARLQFAFVLASLRLGVATDGKATSPT